MNDAHKRMNRRQFTAAVTATAAALALRSPLQAAVRSASDYTYCAFIKFLQTFSYEELAEKIAQAGFDGVEATCRQKNSYIRHGICNRSSSRHNRSQNGHRWPAS